MKTIPSGWPALIDGSFTVAYLVHITTTEGTHFRWGTMDTSLIGSWTDSNYESGRITRGGLGSVTFAADLRNHGGLGQVGDWEFNILNHDDYWGSTLEAETLDNATVEVRRIIIEDNPVTTADGVPCFTGIISDYWHDDEHVFFRCQINENEHTTIPRKMIEESNFPTADFGANRTIPENSKGRPIPIQWGELPKAEAFFCNADTTEVEAPEVATSGSSNTIVNSAKSWTAHEHQGRDVEIVGGAGKGQLQSIYDNNATTLTIDDVFQSTPASDDSVYRITDTQFDMVISDAELKEFSVDGNGDYYIWFWDETAQIYVPCNKKIITLKNNSSPFTGMAGLRFIAGVVKKNEITFYYPFPFTELRNTGAWTNPNNAIDWDNTTYANRSLTGPTAYDTDFMQGRFETDMSDMIGDWDGIYMYCVAYHDNGVNYGLIQANVFANNPLVLIGTSTGRQSSNVGYLNNIMKYFIAPPSGFPSASANCLLSDVSSFVTAGDWMQLNFNRWFNINFTPSSDTGTYNVRIYEAGLIFTKTVPLNERSRFFSQIKGRMYGDTWGSRKTAANLVEHPVDVVEKILRDDLGVAGASIDTTNFDAASAARSGYEMAYSINKEINSINEIEGICKESCMLYTKRYDGTHTLKPLDISQTPVRTIGNDDILIDEYSKKSTLSVRHSDLDMVFNELYVHYYRDPATEEYQKLKYVKTPSAAAYDSDYTNLSSGGEDYWYLCYLSYNKYGFTRTKHIYLDRVLDDATAEAVIKKIIWWYFIRVSNVDFQTQLQNSDLEVGDVFYVSRLQKYFMLSSITEDLNKDTIRIKGREMINERDYELGK